MANFKGAGAFAAHLTRVAGEIALAETRGLDSAARVIEEEAKSIIGTYQREDMGSLAPWPELSAATKADRLRQGFTENDPGERTGDMRESISRSVSVPLAAVGSNDDKLVWFELGTEVAGRQWQPPRSVLGLAAHRQGAEAAIRCGAHVAAAVAGLPTRND